MNSLGNYEKMMQDGKAPSLYMRSRAELAAMEHGKLAEEADKLQWAVYVLTKKLHDEKRLRGLSSK